MIMNNTPADLANESATTENLVFRVSQKVVRDIDITVPTGLSETDLFDIVKFADEQEMGFLETNEWGFCTDEYDADPRHRAIPINGKWWVEPVHVEGGWPDFAMGDVHRTVVMFTPLENPLRFRLMPAMSEGKPALALVYHLETHLVVIGFWNRHIEVGVIDGDTAPNPNDYDQILPFGGLNNKLRVPRRGPVAPLEVHQFLRQCGILPLSRSVGRLRDIASLTDSHPEGYDFVLGGQFRTADDPYELLRRR